MWKPESRNSVFTGGNVLRFKVLGNNSFRPLPKSGLTLFSRLNFWFLILKKQIKENKQKTTRQTFPDPKDKEVYQSLKFHVSDILTIWEVDRAAFTYS